MTFANQAIQILGLTGQASGQASGRTTTINVTFKVGTAHWSVSPGDVLEAFIVGSPLHMYASQSDLNKILSDVGLKTLTSPYHRWPEGTVGCVDETVHDYDPNNPNGLVPYANDRMLLTNVSISGRDGGGKSKTIWLVNCTFTDSSRDQGYLSSPVITPIFGQVDSTVEAAEFEGWFNRNPRQTSHVKTCESRPGEWQAFCVAPQDGPLPPPIGQSGAGKPIAVINSAGDLIKKPLKAKYSKEIYEVEWFSYTMLNMHCAIGKVNSNEYTLKAYDRPPSSKSFVPLRSAQSELPVGIFCKKFAPRELLVESVTCSPMNWVGRNCYKYTVRLVADPDFHKVYVLDSGKNHRAKIGDTTNSGSTVTENDLKGTTQQTQSAAQIDGKSKEILLDGDGKPLADGQNPLDASNAVYLRYNFRETIEFPNSNEITSETQYHIFDVNADFQFMMDGGERYRYSDQVDPWPDCDPANEIPQEPEVCKSASRATSTEESSYPAT